MKRFIKSFVVTALAFSLVGCGSKNSGDTASDNILTVAKENDVISLNSMYATDGMSFEVIHAAVDGLMTQDAQGNIIEAIAKSYEVSDDGLVYTFKLRDDAKWTNGTPVTANDFEFAWKFAVASPDAEYSYLFTKDGASIAGADEIVFASEGEKVDADTLGIKAIDDTTLEVKLSQATPYFLSLMTFPVFYPVNEEFYNEQGEDYAITPDNFMANGAFVLDSWERGAKIELSKNEDYYDAENVKIDGLVFQITPEVSTSVTAFEGGTVDFTKLSSTLVDKYKDSKEYSSILDGYLWYFQTNLRNEIMANKNFRLALAHAVDYDELVNGVLKDGSVKGKGFAPEGLATGPDGKDFRETAGDYYDTDTTKAQEYFDKALKELGKDSISIELLYENADPAKSAAEYLKSNLEQTLEGLTIEMNMQSKESRLDLQRAFDFELILTRWGPDYADPTTYLNLMLDGNAYNYGGYTSEAYDGLLDKAATAATPEARWDALIEAEKQLMNDLPAIPLFQVGGASLIAEGVSGIENHAVGVPYIYKNAEIK